MKLKYVGETPIRLGDLPIKPGDSVEVEAEDAKAMVDSGKFELAEKKIRRKKAETAEEK